MIRSEMMARMSIKEFNERLILRHTELHGTPKPQQKPEEMYNALNKFRKHAKR